MAFSIYIFPHTYKLPLEISKLVCTEHSFTNLKAVPGSST